jgi:hypothetical protein
MRVKFPQIFVYKEYLDMYTNPSTLYIKNDAGKYIPATPEVLEKNPDNILFFKDTTNDGAIVYHAETPKMLEKRKKIINLLTTHMKTLKSIEESMVSYVQEYRIEFPTLYFAVLADARGSDSSYLTAKSMIPMMDGKNKEIRIYLGLDKEFPNYKTNPKVLDFAENKMKATLRNKLDNGEFDEK